jgi:hypothetical protein
LIVHLAWGDDMVLKNCEACGKLEETVEEKHDIYGVCEEVLKHTS